MSASPAASYLDQIIAHCEKARFTGLLRMRTRQGEGELWFYSGVQDDARFGVSHGDEAMERMVRASDPTFELVQRLPPQAAGSKKSYPLEGELGELRPVDLFRLCETNAITCKLEITRGKTSATARYQLGELLSVESESADASAIGAMLEWTEGSYRFELPPLELPPGVPAYQAPAAPLISGISAPKLAAEQEAARRREADEAAKRHEAEAEARRREVEEASKRRQAEEARNRRMAEEEAAAKRKAEEEAVARRGQEEAQRRKAEEEAARARKAEEEAAQARKAEEEAAQARKAEEEAAQARKAEEEAAQARKAEEEAIRRKAISVHRVISVGTPRAARPTSQPPAAASQPPRATSQPPRAISQPPRPLSEPPRPEPRTPAEPPEPNSADLRVHALAEAWLKAEEAAEARLKSEPPPRVQPSQPEPTPEPEARPVPLPESEPKAEPAPAAIEPKPEPKPRAVPEPATKPRARVERMPSEPPQFKRKPWLAIVIVLLVLALIAYFVLRGR